VYQGSPVPATAFLAVGSKAAGMVLLIRVLFSAVPVVTAHGTKLLMLIAGATILYGNLCAIPQRNLKRLLGYSSIAHAGYLLLGVTAMNAAGSAAILYYLTGYLFTTLAAFTVKGQAEGIDKDIESALKEPGVEDVTAKYRGGPRKVIHAQRRRLGEALSQVGAISLLHARGDYAAAVTGPLSRARGLPMLWDCRGDSRAELRERVQRDFLAGSPRSKDQNYTIRHAPEDPGIGELHHGRSVNQDKVVFVLHPFHQLWKARGVK
jgi:hypothetical protein